MNYWLMKTEPNAYSIDDLARQPKKTDHWDGVRNYQVRNMMRDDMQPKDLAFFYHSSCKIPGIVGIVEIVKKGYPDFTAWDPDEDHYDPKSTPDDPRWYMVDVKLKEKFKDIITLADLKKHPKLSELLILKKGNRLSITPIQKKEWNTIIQLKSEL